MYVKSSPDQHTSPCFIFSHPMPVLISLSLNNNFTTIYPDILSATLSSGSTLYAHAWNPFPICPGLGPYLVPTLTATLPILPLWEPLQTRPAQLLDTVGSRREKKKALSQPKISPWDFILRFGELCHQFADEAQLCFSSSAEWGETVGSIFGGDNELGRTDKQKLSLGNTEVLLLTSMIT